MASFRFIESGTPTRISISIHSWCLGRPEIADFWGLGGPGGPHNHSKNLAGTGSQHQHPNIPRPRHPDIPRGLGGPGTQIYQGPGHTRGPRVPRSGHTRAPASRIPYSAVHWQFGILIFPVFGRFSAKLGPKTRLERRGSSCSAGCTTNQPRRPILRPCRGNSEFGVHPLQ